MGLSDLPRRTLRLAAIAIGIGHGPRGRHVAMLALAAGGALVTAAPGVRAQVFDRYVLIQPIQVCDDNGTNCAAVTSFPAETRAIYRQAGVMPVFLETQYRNNTTANWNTDDLPDIDEGIGGKTVQAWFLSDLAADPDFVTYGLGQVPGNLLAVNATAVLGFSEAGRIDTFAHELGHNFGLSHTNEGAGGADNLMTDGSTRTVPGGIDDINPRGAGLDTLTDLQITRIRTSPLAQPASDCLGTASGDVITKGYLDVCLNLHTLDGADRVTLQGGVVLQTLSGGVGNDIISVEAGGVGGDLLGEDGADILRVFAEGFVMGAVDGGAGGDVISIAGEAATVLGGTGSDTIAIEFGALIDGNIHGDDGDGDESNGDGSDFITMTGGVVGGSIFGEGGGDTITVSGGSIGGDIDGGGGNDAIRMLGGTLGGSLIGGGGADTIDIDAGTVLGSVLGGTGADTITISGGDIHGNVDGEDDDDTITISGTAIIAGHLNGGAGADHITMSGGKIERRIDGGAGDDLIEVSGGTITEGVLGYTGDDTITISGGSIGGGVDGESGNDTITISGGTITGNVDGGDGDDRLDISSGSIGGSLLGGAGADGATWSGGTITVAIDMGTGEDVLEIFGTNFGGTAQQAGLTHIEGGGDAGDRLDLHGVAEVLTDLRGWDLISLMDSSAGDLGPASRTIAMELFTIDPTSTLIASSPAGGQVFTLDGDLASLGLVQMQGGTYDALEVTGQYLGGADSSLAMDTFFGGAGAPSDLLRIGAGTTGTTVLLLDDTNAAGPGAFNPEGIELVRVEGVSGTTARGDFELAGGPVRKDLWIFDLGFDDSRSLAGRADADVHVLYSRPGDEVMFTPRFAAGALAVFDAGLAPWSERQRATAPATARQRAAWPDTDSAAPQIESWFTAFGARRSGTGAAELTLLGDSYATATDDHHSTHGAVVGLDRHFTLADGREWMIGVFAGQVVAVTRADRISLRGEFSGATLGLHAGYTGGGWRLGAVVKADFLDFDWSAPALGLEASTDVTTFGARIEAAYRPATSGPVWIEPRASLTWARSDWGRLELLDTGFDLSGNESLLGRAGLRLGRDIEAAHARIELFAGAGIVREFRDTSRAEVRSGGYTLPLAQNRDREALEIEAGVRWSSLDGNMAFTLTSGGRFSGNARQVDAGAMFEMRF